jgi:sec-independent protein translocase protein TatB
VPVSFGLTFDKLVIILLIAVFLIGPDRLPHYAQQLGRLVRSLRDMANGAKDRMRDEMGPEFDEIDWQKLDPRQYDPRRIIREALLEDAPGVAAGAAGAGAAAGGAAAGAAAKRASGASAGSSGAGSSGSRPRAAKTTETLAESRLRSEGKGPLAPFDAEST